MDQSQVVGLIVRDLDESVCGLRVRVSTFKK